MANPFFLLLASVLPSLVVAQSAAYYAALAADSAILRGQGNGLDSTGQPDVSYEHGELQWALRQLYESTGNQSYFDYIVEGANRIVDDSGAIGGGYMYVPQQPD